MPKIRTAVAPSTTNPVKKLGKTLKSALSPDMRVRNNPAVVLPTRATRGTPRNNTAPQVSVVNATQPHDAAEE